MVSFKKSIDLFVLVASGLYEKKTIACLFPSLPLAKNLRQINFKKGIDRQKGALYNCQCVLTEALDGHPFGVWLSLVERLVWDQEVAGSNPVTPTSTGYNFNIGNNCFYLAGVVQW